MPVRHGPWWYVTRTIEGESYPVFCRGRSIDDASDVILDCNAEAAGHEYFDVHAVDSSPDHSLLAWSSDIDGGERYTLRVRDLATGADLPDELTGTSSWGGVAWSGDGQWLLYARPDEADAAVPDLAPPPRHPGRRRRARHRGARRALLPRRVADAAASSGSSSSAESKTTSEVSRAPGRRPDGDAGARAGAGRATSSTRVDHWGDRFVVLTNLDAPDFRVMTAPLDRPGEWTELLAPRARPPVHDRRAVRRPPRAARVERRPAQGAGAVPRRSPAGARLRRRAARPRARRQPGVGHDVAARVVPVADDAAVGVRRRRRHRRARSCASRRRRRTSTSTAYVSTRTWATAPDGTAVPVDVVRHVDTPLDGTAPGVVYGYGSYEIVDAAVVLGRPPVAARSRRRVGARPPARRRRARAALVPRRQAAQQAQHVHRHAGVRRAPRRRAARRPGSASPSAAAAPAGCSSARASRCARSCSAAPSPRCRSSTS